ncbi:SDR family oxidoreductase [Halostreptopolyspora alba]|uniref:SDR family oxidoreductase n=2 Tax=Halostreptopolyspora alba TaxID=2487137 RepID=A0A3N0E8V8_9ACTN|nr:SDR family oxidoreductase [Nocardiopsaceae bacterium YIM 96095]
MAGKVVVVTGANTGIGKATALSVAGRGATTILACRDRAKGGRAAEEIRTATGNDEVTTVRLDLADPGSVEECAGEVVASTGGVDVLVNNAGAVMRERELTAQGFERTLVTNHLGHYALTRLLLGHLRRPGRVVSVSSDAHRFVNGIRFDDLTLERGWGIMRAYGHAKLAQILFTRELARRYGDDGVTAHAAHPGFVGSDLYRSRDGGGVVERAAGAAIGLFAKSPAEGAATSIHLAVSDEALGTNGGYWANSKPARASRAATDDHAARRLWETSERLLTGAGTSLPDA